VRWDRASAVAGVQATFHQLRRFQLTGSRPQSAEDDRTRSALPICAVGLAGESSWSQVGSDRGVQYRAVRYTERLAEAQAVASIGWRGDC
jgi:hypothetical protein